MSIAERNRKSANKVQTGFARTDARYWKSRVKKGAGRDLYGVQIQHCGERHFLSLGTGNKDEAASRAVKLFLEVKAKGWEGVLGVLRPKPAKKPATVGEYLRVAAEVANVEPRTLNEYEKSLRRLVSQVIGIDGQGRYDWRHGKNQEWKKKVDAVRLDRITPAKLQAWIKRKLADVGDDPARHRATKNSLNSAIRNAKAIFGKKLLPYVSEKLKIPDPHPFKELRFFPRQSMRYLSKIDPEKVIQSAAEELANPKDLTSKDIEIFIAEYIATMTLARQKRKLSGIYVLAEERRSLLAEEAKRRHEQMKVSRLEQWKILVLALSAGLRFDEIDKLLWTQVDLEKAMIRIEYTPYFRPKTEEAVGEVPIDEGTVALLREWKSQTTGEFVVESDRPPRPSAAYCAYRTRTHQKHLLNWLRNLEIDGAKPLARVQKPIHELRKEAGSLVNALHGIYAASKFLRHSDTRITAAHYLDQKHRVTTGVGTFLARKH